MRFARPELLWLLLVLPLLALAAWSSLSARRRALRRFAGGAEWVGRFAAEVSGQRRLVKHLLLYAALASAIVAAARPQWGTRLEEVTRHGADVVVLLDTSLSMAAEDLAPSRLELARHEVATLVDLLAGDRVALVTFAGVPTLACPLTLDHSAVRLFLDAVEPESTQVPGTALAEAIALALIAFSDEDPELVERSRALVLFTDGEDHEGGIDELMQPLARAGVTVHAIGTGTSRGAPIPVRDEGGSTGFKKDAEGKVVTTRLEEALLQRLALQTGGHYYAATVAEREVEELARAISGMEGSELGAVLRARYEERYQIPLAFAFLALVAESLLGDRRRKASASEWRP